MGLEPDLGKQITIYRDTTLRRLSVYSAQLGELPLTDVCSWQQLTLLTEAL